MTYHLPPDGCNTDSWSCEGPPRPCFEGEGVEHLQVKIYERIKDFKFRSGLG